MTPVTYPAVALKPAVSTFTKWPGVRAAPSGSSTPRFSCLCTLDTENSFHPRWRPPFVSGLSPEDRCHLNGLGMGNGEPAFVTAPGGHGRTERLAGSTSGMAAFSWMCPTTGSSAGGSPCPTHPAGTNDRLWMLESGKGTLVCIDPQTLQKKDVAPNAGFHPGARFRRPPGLCGVVTGSGNRHLQ